MFASTGRFIILGTIFVMVYQGPAANLVLNVDTTGQSMSCGYNEAKREADEFKRDLVKQFEKATLFARKVKNNLMRFVNKVKQAARAVGTAVKKVKTELDKVADYFRGAGKVCQFIENALDYDMLRWIHKLTPCYLVKQATEKVLKLIKFVVKPLVDQVKYEFNVTIELDQDFAFNQQVSTTYDKVFTNVRHEAAQQFIWLTRLVSAVRYLAYIMPFIAILRAIIYLRSYKKKDHYDNTYLSKHMFDIDLARLRQGKETIFPLSQYERIQVIDSFNLRLTTFEFRKLIIAGTFFMISALNAMLYIGLDYLMYGALQLFLFIQSAVTYEQKVAPKFSVSATGSSPLAQMYDFGGGNTVEFTVEDDKLSSCLPDASEPDYEEYKLIFSLLLITFISVITEAYTLRLRHKSCDFYFPRKAKVRAAWLYNQVIQRRGTFLRFLKRQVDNTIGYQAVEKVSVLDRLGATVPCFAFLRRITGHEVKFCIICGKQGAVGDMKGFKHCFSTPKCTGIYCNQCVEDIQNVCSICIEPIQLIYGDSDTSEELNSSDEGSDYYAEDEHVGDELVELFPLRAKMKRIGRKFLMDGIQPERDSSDDEVDFSEERDTGQLLEAFNQELGLETREIERMKKNARLVLDKNHTLQ
ncbi:DC-STAMP domain-containing protein 2 [Halotydeus destructor]|nr:DC-STAMP domain-containing protein 2 [Halotydeus destructor]